MAATPQAAQRNVAGAPDTTRPARLTTAAPRTPAHKVQGPPQWENGRAAVSTPSGPPPLCGSSADSCKPPQQR